MNTADYWIDQGLEISEVDERVLNLLDGMVNEPITNLEDAACAEAFTFIRDNYVRLLQDADLTNAAYKGAIARLKQVH